MLLDFVTILGVICPFVRPRHASSASRLLITVPTLPFPGKSLHFYLLTHSFFPTGAGVPEPVDSVSVLSLGCRTVVLCVGAHAPTPA